MLLQWIYLHSVWQFEDDLKEIVALTCVTGDADVDAKFGAVAEFRAIQNGRFVCVQQCFACVRWTGKEQNLLSDWHVTDKRGHVNMRNDEPGSL